MNDVFPTMRQFWEAGDPAGLIPDGGLTKRELFAAMAMQALVTSELTHAKHQTVAQRAVLYADALITALEKDPESP